MASFDVSNGAGFAVGLVGATAARMITGLVGALLSRVPSVRDWLSVNLRRLVAAVIFLSLLAGVSSLFILPVHAQQPQPDEILQQLGQVSSMNIVDMQAMDHYHGNTAFMRKIGAGPAPDPSYYTNAAMVADLSDSFGSEGGALWAEAYAKNLSGCNVAEGTFHNLSAYSAVCRDSDGYTEALIWGMGPWGLATFNFLEVPDMSTSELAENMYQIILGLSGSSIPEPSQPASHSNAGGTLTQKDATTMALTILKGYAREIDSDEPGVYPGGFQNANRAAVGDTRDVIFVMEAYSDGVPNGNITEDYVSSGAASEYKYYTRSSIVKAPGVEMWYSDDEQVIKNLYGYYQKTEWINGSAIPEIIRPQLLDHQSITFHGMPASFYYFRLDPPGNPKENHDIEEFYWVAGHWFFRIDNFWYTNQQGAPAILAKQAAEILYLLAAQEGMFNSPAAAQSAPALLPGARPSIPSTDNPPDDSSNLPDETLLDMLKYLAPSALLPALGVAGLSILLDLLRRGRSLPPGMVNSPVPGGGPVSPEVAAYQGGMLQKGYQFDPNTRRFYLPKVTSPVDGSLVSRQQAEYEQNLLNQGYVYDTVNGGFVTREWQVEHEQRWKQFVSDRQADSDRAMAEAAERKRRKELADQFRPIVEQMEEQAQSDYRASQRLDNDTIGTLWAATQLTARTVVTGQNADGNVTLASFAASAGMRLGLGVLTMGSSEYAYTAADFGYRTHDRMQEGMSFSEAATNSAAWMGVEYGGFWAAGKIVKGVAGAVKYAAGAEPTLWVGSQIHQVGNTVGNAVRPLDAELAATLKSVEHAVNADSPEAVMNLFRNNGGEKLAELQARGLLTPEQVRTITNVKTSEVQKLIAESTPEAMRTFDKATVKETLIGDSGSTSSRSLTPPKVNSDHDQSVLALFDDNSVTQRANQFMQADKNLTEAQARELAHNQYQAEFTQHHEAILNNRLQEHGLTTQDLDLKNYSGLAGDTRMADSYPAGFTRARMANQGQAQVFRQTPNGAITSTKATGEYVVDREALHTIEATGANPDQAAQIISSRQPRITPNDAKGLLAQQQQAIAKTNSPDKIAKAITRTDKAQRIISGNPNLSGARPPALPNDLVQESRRILSNPGQGTQNVSPGFVQRSVAQIQDIFKASQNL
jgi:hypothetical protein